MNDDTKYPAVFTDNSELNPYTANVKTQTIREACLTVEKWQKWNDYQPLCPPEWRKIHTEWLITNVSNKVRNFIITFSWGKQLKYQYEKQVYATKQNNA